MALIRQANPEISERKAAQQVIGQFEDRPANRNGDKQIRVDGKERAKASFVQQLARKYRRHEAEVMNELAQYHFGFRLAIGWHTGKLAELSTEKSPRLDYQALPWRRAYWMQFGR